MAARVPTPDDVRAFRDAVLRVADDITHDEIAESISEGQGTLLAEIVAGLRAALADFDRAADPAALAPGVPMYSIPAIPLCDPAVEAALDRAATAACSPARKPLVRPVLDLADALAVRLAAHLTPLLVDDPASVDPGLLTALANYRNARGVRT